MISEEQVNISKKQVDLYAKEWRRRKRGCMEIIDIICESTDCNRKDFIVNFKINCLRKS